MNIVYEGIRAGGSMMIVPRSVLDTMNLGGLVALGATKGPKAPAAPATEGTADRYPGAGMAPPSSKPPSNAQ
jgi:hypothetical protein